VGASHGCLDQKRVRLTRRPVNGSLITHAKIDGNPEFFPVTNSIILQNELKCILKSGYGFNVSEI
jgi:hypothetical protein